MTVSGRLQPGLARQIPPLQPGDRLSGAEFERRAARLPESVKAELIGGIVYMAPPAFEEHHGIPVADFTTWLGTYRAATPGVISADNASLRLGPDDRPQPDGFLRIAESHGGRSRRAPDGYVEGPPDLVVEVAASSAIHDLNAKLASYQRHQVQEYIVWRSYDGAIDWFALQKACYQPLAVGPDGIHKSEIFPGLWLDAAAMARGDLARVLAVLQQGISSAPHGAFVARLQQAAAKS